MCNLKYLFSVISVITFTLGHAYSQKTYVPDDNFEQELISLGYDNILDDSVLTSNINTVSNLVLSNKGINDLRGINDFSSLESLNCYQNQLDSLDVSSLNLLKVLNCSSNGIEELDVSNNLMLLSLDVSDNQLNTIDLSFNSNLRVLNINNNFITNLSLSENDFISDLYCQSNLLESLDLRNDSGSTHYLNFDCTLNENLLCIDVDDTTYFSNPFNFLYYSIDSQNNFSFECDFAFGCMDPIACNYDILASIDTASCLYDSFSSTTVIECDTFTWNGIVFDSSGVYSYTTTNSVGCDSTATLHLTINNSIYINDTIFSCDNYYWNALGITLDSSSTYTASFNTINGCDSIYTLVLTIINRTFSSETATSCDSYEWNGATYDSTGTYTFITTNTVGCDSIVTLFLTINDSTSSYSLVTECDSYFWNGNTYDSSGTYSYSSTNYFGCDSTAYLVLTINYSSSSVDSVVACDSYVFHFYQFQAQNLL